MQGEVLIVTGYKEFLRAADAAGKETKKQVREAFREIGEDVRADAARRFGKYDARSAAGFKVRVRARGVSVEQSLRKTTGRRPDYGALQMTKGLLPAVDENESKVVAEMEKALENIVRVFNN